MLSRYIVLSSTDAKDFKFFSDSLATGHREMRRRQYIYEKTEAGIKISETRKKKKTYIHTIAINTIWPAVILTIRKFLEDNDPKFYDWTELNTQ